MINRRVTRIINNSAEITALLSTPDGTNYVPVLLSTDFLYFGFHGKFASRYIQVGVVNSVVSALTIEYWNGATWTVVDDLIDQTAIGGKTLAQSGFISWQNKDDWKKKALAPIDSDIEMYWLRLSVSVSLDALTALKCVLNVFSDDNILRAYFPELVSDVNYLPSNQTSFLQQHVAAKDLVVLRLKQRKIIDDESEIIDANDVAVAATYAAAKLILQPIATGDAPKELLSLASKGFDSEISRVSFATDEGDGKIDDEERVQDLSVEMVRR